VGVAPPISASYAIVDVAPSVASTTPIQPQVGSPLTINGAGFSTGATVTIGGVSQAGVAVVSATRLTIGPVAVGTPLGPQPLIVTSGGQASAPFTVTVGD
jgi:hypothetical protein